MALRTPLPQSPLRRPVRPVVAPDRWLPRRIPGMQLWLDADRPVSLRMADGRVPAVGEPVAQWRDRSGQGHNVGQSVTAAMPTRVIEDGLPGVDFDGSDDEMFVDEAILPNDNRHSIFVAATFRSWPQQNVNPTMCRHRGTGTDGHLRAWLADAFLQSMRTAIQTETSATLIEPFEEVGEPFVQMDTQDIAAVLGSFSDPSLSAGWASYNGYLKTETDPLGAGPTTGGGSHFYVGSFQGNSHMAWVLRELIVFDRRLQPGEIHAVNRYLLGRWRIEKASKSEASDPPPVQA